MGTSDRIVYAGYGACAAIVLGALGPWAVSGPVTSSGVDQYGLYTLLLGGFAGFVLWRWAESPTPEYMIGLSILAGLCLLASGYLAFELSKVLDLPGVSIGWGLVLTIAGSLVLLAVAGLLHRDQRY